MAAWHEPPRKPGLSSNAWGAIAFALYLTAFLGLVGMILWKLWSSTLAGLFGS